MGSKKKKTQKQKDFVKPKLKVGKTAPKASNHTDTSFVAKAISLPHQSLTTKTDKVVKNGFGVKPDVDLSHQLSLTKHHSSSTRKEVLNYIELHLPSNPSTYNSILNSITPLIIDKSLVVRTALVSLLKAIGEKQPGLLELHARSLVLFIHSAMTHILPPVRNDSTKYLEILLDYGYEVLVKSSFVKTLKTFCQLLSWPLDIDNKKSLSLSVTTSTVDGGNVKQSRASHLQVLKKFLEKGVFIVKDESLEQEQYLTIHPLTSLYMIPTAPQPYSHLKLFTREISINNNSSSQEIDLNTITSEDVETRRRVLVEFFTKPMEKGLTNLIKESGEVGKEATSVMNVLEQAIKDEEKFNSIEE